MHSDTTAVGYKLIYNTLLYHRLECSILNLICYYEKMTEGTLEAKISEAIIKFEMGYMDRSPMETKTYSTDDEFFMRLKGVLTRAEKPLTKTA